MTEIVGPVPALPGAIGRAINAPIPSERLAAVRIGVGIALVIDVLLTYLPDARILLGPNGYTSFAGSGDLLPGLQWSLCRVLPAEWGGYALITVLLIAGIALILGVRPRTAAFVAWICCVSLNTGSPYIHNGGDRLRNFLTCLLIFCPSAETWSLGAWSRRGVLVSGWPARLAMVQAACMYGFAALNKLGDPQGWDGSILSASCRDLQWSLWPGLTGAPPDRILQIAALFFLIWQLSFPILIIPPRTRIITLGIGVVFHLLTSMFEIGMFPIYSICLYFPLFPWEQLRRPEIA